MRTLPGARCSGLVRNDDSGLLLADDALPAKRSLLGSSLPLWVPPAPPLQAQESGNGGAQRDQSGGLLPTPGALRSVPGRRRRVAIPFATGYSDNH